jgi:hypothetical protein
MEKIPVEIWREILTYNDDRKLLIDKIAQGAKLAMEIKGNWFQHYLEDEEACHCDMCKPIHETNFNDMVKNRKRLSQSAKDKIDETVRKRFKYN